jgi:hypothetical protein
MLRISIVDLLPEVQSRWICEIYLLLLIEIQSLMLWIRVVDLLVSLLSQSLVKIMHNQFSLSLISRVFRVLNLL